MRGGNLPLVIAITTITPFMTTQITETFEKVCDGTPLGLLHWEELIPEKLLLRYHTVSLNLHTKIDLVIKLYALRSLNW